jgi:hypothetical protein
MNKLFKSRKSKEARKPEAQNGGHLPNGPAGPAVASKARDTDTLTAPEISQPQNPSVATSIDGECW